MTLDEWIMLSPAERNEHRLHWEHDCGEWQDLLTDARGRFEARFGSHPLIRHIGQYASAEYDPAISVTTALYSPQIIEELPDRFCTFRVAQTPILDSRDFYLRYWVLLFAELLGWTKEETLEWAHQWDDDLNGRNGFSWFYHEDAYYYVLPVVVSKSISTDSRDTHHRITLCEEICNAIRSHASEPIWLSPYDWDAARARVNAILSKVGGRLPRS
jgi:hypothetical protein